jgi:Mg-chelatase subunit ChlD
LSFLAPLFLAGLTALAIPVVIHMINRERREVVPFPSLMFLQRIPYRSVRRQKLRHIFLLAMRCLALALLVMAFARPFVQRRTPTRAAGVGARELVVLVDRSYSMGARDHWTRAQAAARRAVSNLGPTDRATLVAFDDDAAAVTPPTHDAATLNAAIGALQPGSEATRYAPPLKLASQILAGSNLPRREVVLISDFQRLGWSLRDEIAFPPGTTITNLDVAGADTTLADAAVADVNVQRNEGERDRAAIAARLTNTGAAAVENLDVTLELNGRIAETKRVTIPARSAAQVRFTPIAIPSGTSAGVVQFAVPGAGSADQLAANDRYYFTIAPDAAVSLLIVEPSAGRANQSLYLSRALAIGDRPSFRIDVRKSGGLAPADLEGRSLIIFDEVPPPSGDGARRLHDFLDGGGGVLVIAGDQLPAGSWGGEWSAAMPGLIGTVVDRAGDAGGTLAWIDYDHPVFDVFNAPRSGDFATARFLRYRRLTVRTDTARRAGGVADSVAAAHVLARFDDGAPALVEQRVGRGKVLVWASTLDSYWNDLALQPVFLPFVHQVAKYAGRYSGARASFTAGEVLDLSRHAELSGAAAKPGPVVVEAPSGAKTRLASSNDGLVALHEQGFYEVRPEGAARGMGQRVAVNLDPAEANLARIDPQELKASVLASAGGNTAGAVTADAPTREDSERRQTIWWYLLAFAGVLLATETLMSNRLSRRNS